MKKILFLVLFASAALCLSAQNTALQSEILASCRKATPASAASQPEGEVQNYVMSAMVYGSRGITSEEGMANQLVYDNADGVVYFRTFFPLEGENYAFWHKGKVYDHQILISKDDVVYEFEYDGITYEVKLGDMTVDAWGVSAVRDVLLEYDKESGRIYVDDDKDAPERYIGLYAIDPDGQVQMFDYTFVPSMTPFEPGELVVVPADAKTEKYIYYTTNYYDEPSATEGTVSIVGDDYYFDHLTKHGGVVKGKREGNKVTVADGQYIGYETGYYLYAGGYFTNWQADENGDLIGESSSMTFTIDDDGKTLRLDDPGHCFAITYRLDGLWYEYEFNHRIEPYVESGVQTPADPTDLVLQNYSPWWLFHAKVTNMDIYGKALDIDKITARIYVNEEAFTFEPSAFKNLTEPMDYIPYGFCDVYPDGDDIYSGQNKYVILFNSSTIQSVGIQYFYTVDGVTTCSSALSVDTDGNVYDFEPVGINSVVSEVETCPTWYDLNGRPANGHSQHGVYLVDGKKILVK